MDRFIARENIKHFVDRLETETDQPTRSTLQKLLLAEVDKFAKLSDRSDALDENIFRVENKIERLHASGLASEPQRFEYLEELRDLLTSKRHMVARLIDQSAVLPSGAGRS